MCSNGRARGVFVACFGGKNGDNFPITPPVIREKFVEESKRNKNEDERMNDNGWICLHATGHMERAPTNNRNCTI